MGAGPFAQRAEIRQASIERNNPSQGQLMLSCGLW